ncbi:MAG: hypothetical protein EZS28_023512 [Streblomastix strix]|uniref:proton-translocating NAD(P)(+) transhydrogenase n=1 Tax=Streblomastix strix TaxID=222440 RepID=A0A5J4VEK8_9EUKA|nr:MAG: hypothetical protein EZS28_023512 [Streblomastix strix]
MGFSVWIEIDAGMKSKFTDDAYIKAGAEIVKTTQELYNKAEIILKVRPTQVHITHNAALLKEYEKVGVTAFGMDLISRKSRAQKCDLLSSMARISGYSAIIEAVNYFPRY